ncbi:hypothetical protein JW899_00835 [Candidatus Uhrbacteria bacterium]|nr:hypothetical protein [Candidatus Uhrbacteria bacterium]
MDKLIGNADQHAVIEPQVDQLVTKWVAKIEKAGIFRWVRENLPKEMVCLVGKFGPNAIIVALNSIKSDGWFSKLAELFARELSNKIGEALLKKKPSQMSDAEKETVSKATKSAAEKALNDFEKQSNNYRDGLADMSFAEILGWLKQNRPDVFEDMKEWVDHLSETEYDELAEQMWAISSVLELVGLMSIDEKKRLRHLDKLVTSKKERGLGGTIARFLKRVSEPAKEGEATISSHFKKWDEKYREEADEAERKFNDRKNKKKPVGPLDMFGL